MGIISVEGMQFYAYHGYYNEERIIGGNYIVDVYVHINLDLAAKEDDLQKTVDYQKVFELTKQEMETPSALLENVCKRIIDIIVLEYPLIKKIRVKVNKLRPPFNGEVEKAAVEIEKLFD